jgi:hypothetical protein
MRLGIGPGKSAFENFLHQDDSTARGVHFLPELTIRWAGCEAESAMDARLDGVRHRPSQGSKLIGRDSVQHRERVIVVEPQFLARTEINKAGRSPSQLLCLDAI